MSDLNCPYCNAEIEIFQDDGHGTDESEIYREQCPKCEKYFTFTVAISFDFTADKADCLNGAPHRFSRVGCTVCGEKTPLQPT